MKALCRLLSLALLAFLAHCNRCSGGKEEGGSGAGKGAGLAVAKIGSRSLSAGDIAQHLVGQTEASRLALSDKAARRQFIDGVVRFELLAAAAEKRGYGRDPQVIRGMKQQMIARMLEDDVAKQPEGEVPAEQVARYYDEHREEFQKPAAVSIREILVRDKASAETIASQARAARKPDFAADQKAFEDLSMRYRPPAESSAAQASAFFEESGSPYPQVVTRAALALTELGAVAGPVESERGFHVLKLAGRRPEVVRTLDQVREQIRQRLLQEMRNQRMEAIVAELRKQAPVEIDEGALDRLRLDESDNGAATPER